jgi:sugar phosphate isomerase/epimerase
MQLLRFAVATTNFRQPLKLSLKTAVETGATGVQFAVHTELRPEELTETGRKQLLHFLDELSLKTASLHLPMRRALGDLEELDNRLSEIRKAMEFAYQLKTPLLTLRIGRIPQDEESAEYGVLREVLNDLASHGNHVGTTLCLIPTNDTAESLLKLVNSVTMGLVGIDFDPASFITENQNPIKALRTLYKNVLHVQARDAIRDVDGSGLEMPLGRGEVDWDELVALLAEIPYNGWVTVNRSKGENRINETAAAVQFLTEIGFN